MTFKTYHTGIIFRILILVVLLWAGMFFFFKSWYLTGILSLLIVIFIVYEFFRFLSKRFEVIDDFFESVKYKDFSRLYLTENKNRDIKKLYEGFNTVNEVVRDINSEKETQYLYLQKILELVEIGILAYEIESGKVLWSNDSFQNTLDFPSFKNIQFVSNRNTQLYKVIFNNFYAKPTTVELNVKRETIKVLLSNSIFKIGEKSFKLVVLHNIEDTLNKTESEAWKKLLSVMTHEIMNSIAPISSLANTLKLQVQMQRENPFSSQMDIDDLDSGLSSIEKRSEGLLKFAKTYRSLNKVTSLNLEKVKLKELFNDLEQLMQSQLKNTNVKLSFDLLDEALEIEMDTYLMEQVLINLILNAIEASKEKKQPAVQVAAGKKIDGRFFITVSDNGTGISEEIKDAVFVPFFTTKKDGSGIGLSLSKQIMTLHGGKIQINNMPQRGVQVSLVF